MRTLGGKILKSRGWKILGEFPDIKKSITIFAPHTNHIDAITGKLGFSEIGIKYLFLSKKELFIFPFNIVMKWFGSMAVRGVKGENAIFKVVEILDNTDELHIVISPEGWITKQTKWNKGFYLMAKKAKVPIVVTSMDYSKKELKVEGVIHDLDDFPTVMKQINEWYKDIKGKNPERFSVDLRYV
ncbi:MAG: glycerol acyltransferase [Bacteroidota bacterium]|nr:glycerol acyltransferase [Bacteroidota bacterium]